ncbi:hypothetical protein FPOAC2_04315 [Fusarium poae]|uniref:F-box domain-containing protein n=1 Tax=Fusarium poae TaxID=36050 RepID=A0A1B8ARU8_FUSPO|nr:hypothetical protein FPOAC1_004245 [Fusarium poae]KAG8671008.1 hypothetical protein FPOAC1_004245 [Fusarium poae]OBS23279.1 hypothetical protein FPOA_03831 [Fusarium poae]
MSIVRCPTEVLHHIFCLFCLHCHNTKCIPEDVDQNADYKALLALTQTNKRWRTIAMPILFHYPNKHLSSTYLFNVLNCQPNLARCALSLDLSISDNRAGRKHCSNDLITQMVAERVTKRSFPEPLVNKGQTSWESSLLLNLCSNITRLAIGEEGALDLRRHNLSQWEGSKLPTHLKYLEINMFIVSSWLCPILSSLLLASPELDTLVFRGYGTSLWRHDCELDVDTLRPVMERLTNIQLLGHTLGPEHQSAPILYPLIAAACNLRTFKYVLDALTCCNWGFYSPNLAGPHYYLHQSPSYIVGMLKAARNSLQHLTLDFNRMRLRSESMFISPREIHQFVRLHTLEIDQNCYCRHQLGRERLGEGWDKATYLADFLPTTVRRLTIFWTPGAARCRCSGCILYLGKRAVAGHFPNLEIVQVDIPFISDKYVTHGFVPERTWKKLKKAHVKEEEINGLRIKEAFEGSGVETRIRIWYATDGVSAYVDGPSHCNISRAFPSPYVSFAREPVPVSEMDWYITEQYNG